MFEDSQGTVLSAFLIFFHIILSATLSGDDFMKTISLPKIV